MSAVESDDFKEDDLFSSQNIAKYDQNIDFLLNVPANTKVPLRYTPPALNYGGEKDKEPKKQAQEQDYTFTPLFDLEEEVVTKPEKAPKEFVASPFSYNWSKASVIDQIVKLFPPNINFFYDVFSGAGNVGINTNAKVITCVDTNSCMTQLLQFLQKHDFESLSRTIDFFTERYNLSNSAAFGYAHYQTTSNDGLNVYNREAYLKLRSDFNHLLRQLRIKNFLRFIADQNKEQQSSLRINKATKQHKPKLQYTDDLLIRLLMLIIFGFNSFARFNSSGEFNLPVGKRDFSYKTREKFKAFYEATKNKHIEFVENSFLDLDINQLIQEQAFVFLDPPCILNQEDLQVSTWSEKDEEELYLFIEELDKNQIQFALSTYIQFNGRYNYALLDWCHTNRFNINFIRRDTDGQELHSEEEFARRTLEVVITNYF
ncbi:hypothetical protein CJP74_02500 [Psittacicella melopsittaci]|uniref:DNA adenine methylase n=1 Tax=Psittacicella melopsittaci TaxID=2028576 RepID=A0A3A1Y6S6_9GAMM|nr:DNA adenine methylase [Psittacicella melopsittaci]RIY33315.1 hypothetical protein CJP74_02500 [Psittacicella melopsittaci]